jgi:hypothetical protein
VLSDGLTFAGGFSAFVWAPLRSALSKDAYSSSLLVTAFSVVLAAGLLRAENSEPMARDSGRKAERFAILSALVIVVVALGSAVAVLLLGVRVLPRQLLAVTLNMSAITGIGIVLGCAYSLWPAHSKRLGAADPEKARILALLLVFSLIAALLREPWLFGIHPSHGGDVLTAISLIFVFLAAESAHQSFARPLILALLLLGMFGLKLHRALDASTLVRDGYWSNLYVNHRGLELLGAARRVRELSGPEDTVLVLPEDPQITALIGRPRPRLRGSVVFSNHYPARLLENDRAELEQRPPRVIVLHPRRVEHWQAWLAAFSPHAAATALSLHMFIDRVPARYRLDSTYRTTYVIDQGALEIWQFDQKSPRQEGAP